MASAMDGMDLAEIKIGDNVLLQGCGAIGSIILNMLPAQGRRKRHRFPTPSQKSVRRL